ncbi:MAG TPA: ATP-binding protein [Urbifossiella sp.]|jgi:two-component system sensor histidine kinase HydH|nr:ATP-binding protein [Urbifossiella sp.]
MSISSYPRRLLFVTVTSCGMALVLCGTVALSLYREQARTAAALGEDIGSRGAAINLEATLNALAMLHDRRSPDVEPLHRQAEDDLVEIDRHANKPEERQLAGDTAGQFTEYVRRWRADAPPAELAGFLRERALPAVQTLRVYNGEEMKRSEDEHRRSLRRMAWGLAAVGGLGSAGGLVLGYGLARSLRRTIHHFLVRVQGASDLLGRNAPTVEWARSGEPLRDGADDLLRRVEQVVLKLQQREREVLRAERLAAVGQLAAGVAHEVRNPLTAAVLLIETARKDPAAGGLTDEDLDLIEAELHRAERSLQALLDYARPPRLERSTVDLAGVVRDAVGLARGRIDRQRVVVKLDAPPGGCRLEADPDQLRQVVLNLILNSLDVMPHGGTLRLAVAPPAGRDNTVALVVGDTGPGIPEAVLPRLFEPFATGKETGLGLGLSVCRRIVEDHGGTVVGENPPGGGARFTVRLPARVGDEE